MAKMLFMAYGAMSLLVFFVFVAEAQNRRFHMPSRDMFLLSLLCGSYGTLFGMLVFNRKWRRPLFRYGIPLLIVAHTCLIALLMRH